MTAIRELYEKIFPAVRELGYWIGAIEVTGRRSAFISQDLHLPTRLEGLAPADAEQILSGNIIVQPTRINVYFNTGRERGHETPDTTALFTLTLESRLADSYDPLSKHQPIVQVFQKNRWEYNNTSRSRDRCSEL